MVLTLRRQHPTETVAFTVWGLPSETLHVAHVSQADYDAANRAATDPPGRPDPAARFLFGAGGIAALDTPDGWPAVGDCWEDVDADTGESTLSVALSPEPDWRY